MKYKYLVFVLFIFLFSCKKEDLTINPELIGYWKAVGVVYQFKADNSFSIVYSRTGDEQNPVVADSVFGTYIHYNDKKEIEFSPKGYKNKSTQDIIFQESNAYLWSYDIENNTLKYSSPTMIGELIKTTE